jgi:phosphoribosylaminoimidazole (AIR) synthetase
MHADGAGTKSLWLICTGKKHGAYIKWRGIAQDALILNIDDLIMCGNNR